MTQERKQALLEAGVAVEEALTRCMGNEMLLERLLNKFVDDRTYAALLQAMKEKNQEYAVSSAHTLKGICANLSMKRMYCLLEQQVELLRQGNWDEAEHFMSDIKQTYDRICLILGQDDINSK